MAAACPSRVPAVTVALDEAVGRVTAEPIWASRSSPPFDAAAMDGIALRAVDSRGASETTPLLLAPDAFAVVDTGDPLPDGYDAVVMREHVHYVSGQAELRAAVAPYQHVRSIGEDISATELLLPAGHRLRAVDVAAAAAAGTTGIVVRRAPVVAILPTGDEMRPAGSELAPGELLDTNSLMLAAQARAIGCEAITLPIEPDDQDRIAAAIREAIGVCDLMIVIAGSSAGRDDYTAQLVAQLGTLAVHGVAVRPGHPVVLGAIDATPVIGAPGYPVSASLTFDIFAVPLLADLEGAVATPRPQTRARLARKVVSVIGSDDWVRVRLGRVGGGLVALPLPRGAGVLTSLVRADGLLVIPTEVEGHHAGEEVDISLLRSLPEIEGTIVAIGSHDPILDLAASELRTRDPRVTLASSNVGSLGGLIALRDGLCHLAGSHLLEPDTGEYTIPYVEQMLAGHDIAIVRLVHREQGLIVAPGNPLGVGGTPTSRSPSCATSTASGARAPASCSTTNCSAPASTPPPSAATRARSRRTWPSPRPSPRAGPTAAWACRPPPERSGWTSCPSPKSPSTWCLNVAPPSQNAWRHCGHSWRPRSFVPRSRRSVATTPARWAVASARTPLSRPPCRC